MPEASCAGWLRCDVKLRRSTIPTKMKFQLLGQEPIRVGKCLAPLKQRSAGKAPSLLLASLLVTEAWFSFTARAQLAETSIISWGNGVRPVDYEPPSGLSGLIDVAAGWSHVLALKKDGTVVAWGEEEEWVSPITVPSGLTGVIAIAAGFEFDLALIRGGTVVQWGNNSNDQGSVPDGLSGVTAIAAGGYHSLALKQDGTVVAWGNNQYGQATVPSDLNGVVAIAAGQFHSLALKQDGTVVTWGAVWRGVVPATVPTNLTGVIAIAAGKSGSSLALKGDGTVVAWESNDYGQAMVPVGLDGVVAIAGGAYHSVALKRDGTVVAWGREPYSVPELPFVAPPVGLSNVIAITAGNLFTVALVYAPVPSVIGSPQTQTAEAGSTVYLRVSAKGAPPLSHQWFFNGTTALVEGTNSILELTNVQFSQVGTYNVVVSNKFGSTNSTAGALSVIPSVTRSTVSVIKLSGEIGTGVHLDYADRLGSGFPWLPLEEVALTNSSQVYVDNTVPMPNTRFYRAWQTNMTSIGPIVEAALATMIPITGSVGSKVQVDYINQVGPTNDWVRLDTVTLTNTSQAYYDLSMFRQANRLYRLVVLP